MTKTGKRKFGDFGENIAKKFLMKRGFTVIESNYLRPWGEIDLIAKKGEYTHFVEVKSAVSYETAEGGVTYETIRPEENIHPKKLERMHRAVETYCLEHNIDEGDIQIDAVIVAISKDNKRAKVTYIDNVL